jgi:hypothetical protein
MEKVPSLSSVSLSALFFWNQLTALGEGCLYIFSYLLRQSANYTDNSVWQSQLYVLYRNTICWKLLFWPHLMCFVVL